MHSPSAPTCTSAFNQATQAAVAFLQYPEADPRSSDGFQHLVAVCLKALGLLGAPLAGAFSLDNHRLMSLTNLVANQHVGSVLPNTARAEANKDFVEIFLLERLNPYRGKSETEIHQAAQRDEFRYLPRQCKLALIDRIRQVTAQAKRSFRLSDAAQGIVTISLDAPAATNDEGQSVTVGDGLAMDLVTSTCSPLGTPASLEPGEIREFIETDQRLIRNELGDRLWQTLTAIVKAYPDKLGKGDVIKTIARERGVSERQARTDKEALRKAVQQAIRGGNRPLQQLYSWLERAQRRQALHISDVRWEDENK